MEVGSEPSVRFETLRCRLIASAPWMGLAIERTGLTDRKDSVGITEITSVRANRVEHCAEQVVQWCVLGVLKDTTGTQLPSTAACQENRQIMMVVPVAVIDRAAIDDQGVIEQVPVTIGSLAHLLQEVTELLAVVAIDLRNFLDVFLFVFVMGKLMVTVFDLDHGERAVASLVGQHETGDTGRVGSKGQDHQVVHEPNVLGRVAGFFGRRLGSFRQLDRGCEPRDALLEFANTGEVLVEFSRIIGSDLANQMLALVSDEIENARLEPLFFCIRTTSNSKQPIESPRRLDLFARRKRFASPGDVVGVSTRIA